jgi:hypothetical protein
MKICTGGGPCAPFIAVLESCFASVTLSTVPGLNSPVASLLQHDQTPEIIFENCSNYHIHTGLKLTADSLVSLSTKNQNRNRSRRQRDASATPARQKRDKSIQNQGFKQK